MRERAASRLAKEAHKCHTQPIDSTLLTCQKHTTSSLNRPKFLFSSSTSSPSCNSAHNLVYKTPPSCRHFVSLAPIQQSFLYPVASTSRQISSTPSYRPEDLIRLEQYIIDFRNGRLNGSWGPAWDAFTSLPKHLKTPSLSQALISLLATSPHESDIDHVIELFDSVNPALRQPDVYPIVIAKLLKANRIGKAVVVADSALAARINPSIAGIDALLLHLTANRLWQFVFHVYDRCYFSFQDQSFFAQWRSNFFKKAASEPNYAANIYYLIAAIRDFPNSFSPEAHRHFIYGAVETILRELPEAYSLREKDLVLSVFADLRLVNSRLYRVGVLSCLRHPKALGSARLTAAFNIYGRGFVHRGKLDQDGREAVLTHIRDVVHNLLHVAAKVKSKQTIESLYRDWRDQLGGLDSVIARLFIQTFTGVGDPQRAVDVLQDYAVGPTGVIDKSKYSLDLLFPILRSYASRGDAPAIRALIHTMKQQMDLVPNTITYNALLRAYQKNDDLDGALEAFAEILQADLKPDHYTFGSLMYIAARRGDQRLLIDLRKSAMKHDIPMSVHMNESMIVNLLNRNKIKQAEHFAAWAVRKYGPSACTNMYNLILGFYTSLPASSNNQFRLNKLVEAMKARQVPFNKSTYSRLMRASVNAGRTSEARNLLYNDVLKQNLPVDAFHFAILMDGYARESRFDDGMNVHVDMLRRGIAPDVNSKFALMKLNVLATKKGIKDERRGAPFTQADLPLELLTEILDDPDLASENNKGPILGSARFSATNPSPAAHFDLLIDTYDKQGAHDMVEILLRLYQQKAAEVQRDPNMHVPISLFSRLMIHSYNKAQYEEVDQYWFRLKDHARKISKMVADIRSLPNEETKGSHTLLEHPKRKAIGLHRNILARPLNIYMASLEARDLQLKIPGVVNEIIDNGFALTSSNWNNYLRHLAKHGYLQEAFTVAEQHLVPGFRQLLQRSNPSLSIKRTINSPDKNQRSPMINFGTMLLFVQKLSELRQGMQFQNEDQSKVQILMKLRNTAPRLWHAIHRFQRILKYRSPGRGQDYDAWPLHKRQIFAGTQSNLQRMKHPREAKIHTRERRIAVRQVAPKVVKFKGVKPVEAATATNENVDRSASSAETSTYSVNPQSERNSSSRRATHFVNLQSIRNSRNSTGAR